MEEDQITALLEQQQRISQELDFLTLNNRPAVIDDISLGVTHQGYAIKSGYGSYNLITRNGIPISPSNPGFGWTAKGALSQETGFLLIMINRKTSLVEYWNLNEYCEFVSYANYTIRYLLDLEKEKNFDFTEDGLIGSQLIQEIATFRGITLGETFGGFYGMKRTTDNEATLVYYQNNYFSEADQIRFIPKLALSASMNGYELILKTTDDINANFKSFLNSSGVFTRSANLRYAEVVCRSFRNGAFTKL